MKFAVPIALSLLVPAATLAAPHESARRVQAPETRRHASHDPLHLQLARAVFPRERWERLVAQASLELTQRLAQASEGKLKLDPDFADRLRREYERMAPYEELVGNQARILGTQYTATELRQLLAFYKTPLGKKSVLLIHDLTAYSDKQMQQRVHAGIGDALQRLDALVHRVPGDAPEDDASSDEGAGHGPAAPDVSEAGEDAREL